MIPPAYARLPLAFDARPLCDEVAAAGARWQAHFNAGYHDGGWDGMALRGEDGDAARLHCDPRRRESIQDTGLMAQCPAIAAALRRIEAPLRGVRILRLAPGSVIREHRDDDLRFEDGEARLHVPLVTQDAVEFYVDDERVIMEAGECWYLDLSRPHRVRNAGDRERIHLVIDCRVNEWLVAQIAAALPTHRVAARPSMADSFAAFREEVVRDRGLIEALSKEKEPNAFAARSVALAAVRGYSFDEAEVVAAMGRGRRSWLSQWIV